MFGIGGCEEVWSSIFWAQRHGKRDHQMKGCVAEQKVSDWQMNACHGDLLNFVYAYTNCLLIRVEILLRQCRLYF